ncbi:hypothetical protein [Halostagnicola sp. A-GB9-2]|uniref:hypothetical protein n=1 Tax=Halostagnicola sp. A-GB9-2 TaxID=3048066 RepID=UPI0024BFD7CE|nr:hypothetical protein [Halostagnicola sp. A-GB9-2]MDJ1432551.1 hypothetical protein [Halostagnicola sp. A-GB9-2]
MSFRTQTQIDALLAGVSLAAFGLAFVFVEASFSILFFALGSAATVAFELVATRDPEAVRRYWERPWVRSVSLAGAIGVAGVGAVVAPSRVLSAGIGALVMYLLLLGTVVIVRNVR